MARNRGTKHFMTGTALVLLAISATAAAAQTVAPVPETVAPATDTPHTRDAGTAAAPQATTDDDTLGDITVTARKRGESLIDVPVAITALTGDAMAARGIKDLNTLNDFVPGLRYENSSANRNDRGFATITMRGMYPGDSPNRQAVTAFVDGVAIPGGAIPGLTDVERVEVVKGPQSAYFGRSTFAGAINFITIAPSLTDYKGTVSGSYASYNDVDFSASVEGPIITDKLAVRISGRHYSTDGQYKNVGYAGRLGARETNSLAISVIAKPVAALTIRGYFTTWEDNDGPSAQSILTEADYNCLGAGNGRKVNGLNYICGGVGATNTATLSQNTTPGGRSSLSSLTDSSGDRSILPIGFIDSLGLQRKEYQANLTADYDLGGYTLSGSFGKNHNQWAALTDTYNRAPDGTGYYSTVYLPYNIHNTSAELRFASSHGGPFKFMVGGNYYDESIKFQVLALRPSATSTSGAITTLSQPTDYRARTFGIFGSAGYDLTDRLSLSGEGRYQWDQIHHIVQPVTSATPTVDLEKTFKSFAPRIILNYKLDNAVNVYASYAKGTRPGTFNSNYLSFTDFQKAQLVANAGRDIPTAVPEETLTSWEGGLKGNFFDRRVRVLAAVYYAQWRDRQINQNIAYLATPTSSTTSTATLTFPDGSTNLYGLELETTIKPVDHVTIDGTFNWAKTDIRFTACAECLATTGVANPVGNLMERYPEFSGTFGATYDRNLFDAWNGFARADYIYVGKQYATADNITYLKAANRVNAGFGVENGKYRLELFVRNLFDNKVASNILRNANPFSNTSQGLNLIVLAAPERQTFGIRGSAKF
jgi:iron complex outermembrane receptor protein